MRRIFTVCLRNGVIDHNLSYRFFCMDYCLSSCWLYGCLLVSRTLKVYCVCSVCKMYDFRIGSVVQLLLLLLLMFHSIRLALRATCLPYSVPGSKLHLSDTEYSSHIHCPKPPGPNLPGCLYDVVGHTPKVQRVNKRLLLKL